MQKITPEIEKQIVELYNKNKGTRTIAKILNIKRNQVITYLKRQNINHSPEEITESRRKFVPNDIKEQIKKLYLEFAPLEDIQSQFLFGKNLIKRVLKEFGIKIDAFRIIKIKQTEINEMIELYTIKKLSLNEVSRRLHIKDETIRKYLVLNSIQIRENKRVLDKETIISLKKEYNRGISLTDLAIKFNMSKQIIVRNFIENNIKIRTKEETRELQSKNGILKMGNGFSISGYYKSHHFRSLNELSFIINYLEKKNFNWQSAENSKYRSVYIENSGKQRFYYPDFIILDKNLLIECKPKIFWKNENVILKMESAKRLASQNGLKYQLVDFPIIFNNIFNAYINDKIKLDNKSKDRFIKAVRRHGYYKKFLKYTAKTQETKHSLT